MAHGQCKRCNPGFELTQHKSCRPYSCRLGATNCEECLEQPLRSGGFDEEKRHKRHKACKEPARSHETRVGTKATTNVRNACLGTGRRHGHVPAFPCQHFARLTHDLACVAYTCSTGEGTACKTCAPLSERTVPSLRCFSGPCVVTVIVLRTLDNQCTSCNAGYGLVGGDCRSLTCSIGSGSRCKTCRPAEMRTAHALTSVARTLCACACAACR